MFLWAKGKPGVGEECEPVQECGHDVHWWQPHVSLGHPEGWAGCHGLVFLWDVYKYYGLVVLEAVVYAREDMLMIMHINVYYVTDVTQSYGI